MISHNPFLLILFWIHVIAAAAGTTGAIATTGVLSGFMIPDHLADHSRHDEEQDQADNRSTHKTISF